MWIWQEIQILLLQAMMAAIWAAVSGVPAMIIAGFTYFTKKAKTPEQEETQADRLERDNELIDNEKAVRNGVDPLTGRVRESKRK